MGLWSASTLCRVAADLKSTSRRCQSPDSKLALHFLPHSTSATLLLLSSFLNCLSGLLRRQFFVDVVAVSA